MGLITKMMLSATVATLTSLSAGVVHCGLGGPAHRPGRGSLGTEVVQSVAMCGDVWRSTRGVPTDLTGGLRPPRDWSARAPLPRARRRSETQSRPTGEEAGDLSGMLELVRAARTAMARASSPRLHCSSCPSTSLPTAARGVVRELTRGPPTLRRPRAAPAVVTSYAAMAPEATAPATRPNETARPRSRR